MIVIQGTIDFDPQRHDQAVAAAAAMQDETRQEPGCLVYAFALDVGDPGRIHIIERWESEDALKLHFATPHMATFQAAVPSLGVKKVDAVKFQISSSGPVF